MVKPIIVPAAQLNHNFTSEAPKESPFAPGYASSSPTETMQGTPLARQKAMDEFHKMFDSKQSPKSGSQEMDVRQALDPVSFSEAASNNSLSTRGSNAASEAAAMTMPSQAPKAGLKEATFALKNTVTALNDKMGWGRDGVMTGIKMGIAAGIGMGVMSLVTGMPHFGLAMLIVAPAVGMLIGLFGQFKARKVGQEGIKSLLEARDFFKDQGGSETHPDFLALEKMRVNIEGGSLASDVANVYFRLLGPFAAPFKAKYAELQETVKAKLQAAKEDSQGATQKV